MMGYREPLTLPANSVTVKYEIIMLNLQLLENVADNDIAVIACNFEIS